MKLRKVLHRNIVLFGIPILFLVSFFSPIPTNLFVRGVLIMLCVFTIAWIDERLCYRDTKPKLPEARA